MPLSESQVLQIVMQQRTRLLSLAWLITQDAHVAEDLFQNVAVKTITGDATFEAEAAVASWAAVVIRREAIDWQRRQARIAGVADPAVLDALQHDWPSAAAESPHVEALQQCLKAASDQSRQLLRLRYHDGCDCSQVAQRMQLRLATIYKRLSRLHAELRDCVERRLAGENIP